MSRKEIVSLEIERPNPNLSAATKFGNLVFVSGQTGRHPVTGEVGKDVREQTRFTLERIKVILAKYFPTGKPARTTVTVAALNFPELLVEITVTACIPG